MMAERFIRSQQIDRNMSNINMLFQRKQEIPEDYVNNNL